MYTKIILALTALAFSLSSFTQFKDPYPLQSSTYFLTQFTDNNNLDLNNDGNMDFLSLHKSPHDDLYSFCFFESNGDMSFVSPQTLYELPAYITLINKYLVEDINSDGIKDIVFNANQYDLYVLYGNGNGGFNNLTFLFTLNIGTFGNLQFHLEDINEDGQLDVFVKNYNFYSRWYSNSNGVFTDEGNLYNQNYTDYVRLDADNDGDLDLVFTDNISTGTNIVYIENLGNHVLDLADTVFIQPSTALYRYSFDFNDDGIKELVLQSSGYNLIYSFSQNNYVLTDTFPSNYQVNSASGILEVDIDGDGDLDLLAKSMGGNDLVLYRKNNQASFPLEQGVVLTDEITFLKEVYLEDVDGDGINDLSVINGSNAFSIKGLGNGFYQQEKHPVLHRNHSYLELSVGDINGDGITDLFNLNEENTHTNVWVGKGNGLYDQKYLKVLDVNGNQVSFSGNLVGEFTGDNISDYLQIGVFNGTSGISWAVYEGNSTFLLENPQIDMNNASSNVQVFDYDEDGFSDYFYYNSSVDSMVIRHNDGQGSFVKYQFKGPSYIPSEVKLYDVDGDGFKDVTFKSTDIGVPDTLVICYSGSNHSFTNIEKYTPFEGNSVNGIYDFEDITLDGRLDLVVTSRSPNPGFELYQQNSNGTFPITPLGVLPSSALSSMSYLEKIQFVDIDNDSINDLVFSMGLAGQGNLGLYYCKRLSSGDFSNTINQISPIKPNMFLFEDLDKDGDKDLLFKYFSDYFAISINESISPAKLKGHVFADMNGNGIKDNGEEGLPFVQLKTNPNSDVTITDNNGNFDFSLNSALGNYTLFPEKTGWSVSSDSIVYHIQVDTLGTNYTNLDFGLEPDSLYYHFATNLTTGDATCSSLSKVWVNIRNEGTIKPSGVVSVKLDDSLNFFDASVQPDSSNGQYYYFSYNNIGFGDEYKIDVSYHTPSFMSLGTYLTNILDVEIIENGGTISSYTDSSFRLNTCAYDPNDKTSIPGGMGLENYIQEEDTIIEYMIRFQNTGNDTATHVVISDFIEEELDISTFEFLSASHNMTYEIKSTREIVFSFHNIYLPDSNVNYLGSQGYVKFKMELVPGLSKGTVINNTGYIYFDQNPAVITNTAFLTIVDCPMLNEQVTINGTYDSLVCEYYGNLELPTLIPGGGVYTGNGVVNDTMFDPSLLSLGIHPIEYNVTSENGCELQFNFNITVDECLGLEEFGISNIHVYPNPFTENLNVVFNSEIIDCSIQLVSTNGQILRTQFIEKSESLVIERGNLETGVYFLQVVKNNEILYSIPISVN